MHRRIVLATGLLLNTIVLSACSITGAPIVDFENRDTTGKYDGSWVAEISGNGGRQFVGGRTLNCHPIDSKKVFFGIKDGSAKANLGRGSGYTEFHVNENGQFHIRAEAEGVWSNSYGNLISFPEMILLLKADLDEKKGKGEYVVGMAQLNGLGCSYLVDFTNRTR